MLDCLNDRRLGLGQMNQAIGTLLDCKYVHRCTAVFNGEWGVIDRTKIRDVVRQVNDCSGGLDKG
jgi:hypothetical protein